MKYLEILIKVRLNPKKIFECACPDGFKGDFCEFKADQNHLFLLANSIQYEPTEYIINTEGRIENAKNSTSGGSWGSWWSICTTIFKGEAVIFHDYSSV